VKQGTKSVFLMFEHEFEMCTGGGMVLETEIERGPSDTHTVKGCPNNSSDRELIVCV